MSGYGLNSTGDCVVCAVSSPCLICAGTSSTVCGACDNPYYLSNTGLCASCMANCL